VLGVDEMIQERNVRVVARMDSSERKEKKEMEAENKGVIEKIWGQSVYATADKGSALT
jgi:hypothetical protein